MRLSLHPSPRISHLALLTALATLATFALPKCVAAERAPGSAEKEQELIRILKSDAPPQEKAIPCKQLAVYGSKDAVTALAPLLANPDLSSWSRISLEAIPDPAAGDALREAVGTLRGRLLVGVINSLGVRQESKSVPILIPKLSGSDLGVISAAAIALGRIGGPEAAKALEAALATAPAPARADVAEGCVRCAERALTQGDSATAIRLYETVRQSQVAKNKIIEATRGLILARQSQGVPLLVEQLRSTDKGFFRIGLRTARELPGREATDALVAELPRNTPERQALLLSALADRHDASALPAVESLARTGQPAAQVAAVRAVEALAPPVQAVPLLLEVAALNNPAAAQAAKAGLVRLHGAEVDAALLARLPQASGKTRQTLLDVAGQRRLTEVLPSALRWSTDPDPAVRNAALNTLGLLGTEQHVRELVSLLQKTSAAPERAAIEKGLLTLSGRVGTNALPDLLPLSKAEDGALRIIGLHTVATVGGPTALNSVESALKDRDAAVQDEAVRTLSTWPNNWPDDNAVAKPLLALAKSTDNPSHQILGLRGYLQYLQHASSLPDADKVAQVRQLQPQLTNAEVKRAAIAVLNNAPTSAALELVVTWSDDAAVGEEACATATALAARSDLKDASKELRQQALQTVLERSKDDATKKKANDALKKLK